MTIKRVIYFLIGALALLVLAGCSQAANAGSAAKSNNPISLAVDGSGNLLKTGNGIARSADGGQTWQALALPQETKPETIRQVVVNGTTLYAFGPGAGVLRSGDGGKTWKAINSGLPSQEVTAFTANTGHPDSLYTVMAGHEVYISENGGEKWVRADDGTTAETLALTYSPLEGSMKTGWLYAATVNGPVLSMDCFCGWRQIGKLPGNAAVKSVAVDPKQPKRVYALADNGIYRSDDAGETWQAASQGLPKEVAALAVDPNQPQRLYAATAEGKLILSEDGASTWKVLS